MKRSKFIGVVIIVVLLLLIILPGSTDELPEQFQKKMKCSEITITNFNGEYVRLRSEGAIDTLIDFISSAPKVKNENPKAGRKGYYLKYYFEDNSTVESKLTLTDKQGVLELMPGGAAFYNPGSYHFLDSILTFKR